MKIAPVQDTSSVTFGQKAQELPCEMEKQKTVVALQSLYLLRDQESTK